MSKINIENFPISLNNNTDLIGNEIYVDVLKDTIRDTIANKGIETVAIYGDWGIGKSSIIKTVEEYYNKNSLDKKTVKFIKYDAWKYSADDFRKNFLINLNPKYNEILYTTSSKYKYRLNKNDLPYNIIIFLLIIIFVMISCIYSQDNITNKIINSVISIVITYSSATLAKTIMIEDIEVSNKEFSPNDFSKYFSKEMEDKKKSITVFVIDDLDRCSYEKVLEILECINGFMKNEYKNNPYYLFLIPIDKMRLKTALKEIRKYADNEQDRYLDKMFDKSINIEHAGRLNLNGMIKTYCNELNIKLKPVSIDLLSDFYVSTPRDVNKTIEAVNDELKFQYNKYKLKYINEKISEEEIIKLFIIQNKWPKFFEYCLACDDVNKLDSRLESLLDNEINEKEKLRQFIRISSLIPINKIKSYYYLKAEGIYYDQILADHLLSANIDEISVFSNKENIISTYKQIFKDKIRIQESTSLYGINLIISLLYILNNGINIRDIISDIFIDEITSLFSAVSYNALKENNNKERNRINFKKNLLPLLDSNDSNIKLLINGLIKPISKYYGMNDLLCEVFLNEKKNNVLDKENYNKCFEFALKMSNLEENDILFAFKNDDNYIHLINDDVFEYCIENKLYVLLEEIGNHKLTFEDKDHIKSLVLKLNVFNRNINFNNFNSDDIEKIGRQISFIKNSLNIEDNDINDTIYEYFDANQISAISKQCYMYSEKASIIIDDFVEVIYMLDEKKQDDYLMAYVAIQNLRSNSASISSLPMKICENERIQNTIKYDFVVAYSGYSNFSKEFCDYFISCCNKKENLYYIEFIKLLLNQKGDTFSFSHKPFGGQKTTLSIQHFRNNLKERIFEINDEYLLAIIEKLSISPE